MVVSCALAAAVGSPAGAQLVTPKTVPVKQDNQFSIFPSTRAGMADVGIALDDTLADPFVNPARATAIRISTAFALPYAHGITSGRGGGTTLPLGGFGSIGDWTAGTLIAVQQLAQAGGMTVSPQASNRYATAMVARRMGNGLSLGGSAYVAGLTAVDGVDLLFAGNDRLEQSGTLSDFRFGMTKQWGQKRFDVLLLHNRTNMKQDVHYTRRTFLPGGGVSIATSEDRNVDKTLIWGAHTQYVQPVGADGWRIGWTATGNWLSHPKIPNYQIQNIPRDPGNTWSANLGVGVGRLWGRSSFGIDVMKQPMLSKTWGTTENDTAMAGGGVIRAGDRTVSNWFKFSNSLIRLGWGRDFVADTANLFGLQLGLARYSVDYRLHQTNHVQRTERWQDEGWTEWTPTLGLGWRAKDVQVQYTYRRTCGPTDCVPCPCGDKVTVPPPVVPGGVIAAPSSPLRVDGGTAYVHRVMVVVPIR